MHNYLDLLCEVINTGTIQNNRTGIMAKRKAGAMLEFDLEKGFPIVTTKRMAFKAIKGELLGFLNGFDNAKNFRELNCNIWDQNANENDAWLRNYNRKGKDDLGRIYGVQWRDWRVIDGLSIDQLAVLLNDIQRDPTSRRMIVNAWNPGELKMMALPPCHVLWQILVDTNNRQMSLVMYQRSCDMFLGVPFNISSYALLLHIIAQATNYIPKRLCMMLADVHIYQNHYDQVDDQLSRMPFPLPKIEITMEKTGEPLEKILALSPDDIQLNGYQHHPAIKGDMAI